MATSFADKALNIASGCWSWWLDESRTEDKFSNILSTVIVAVLVIFWYKKASKMIRKRELPQPPGPRGIPLLGSLPFLEADLHRHFMKLAEVYGPILKVSMGKKLCVVVSSPALAKEVLRDHDATFANRNALVAGLAATYGGQDIVWSPHGPMLRMLRKVLAREMLTNANIEACYDFRQQEVREKMKQLYSNRGTPVKIGEEVFVMISNVILSMLWGGTLQGNAKSSVVVEFQRVVGEIVELMGRPNVSDIFPVFARFDLQGIERRTKELLSWFDKIFNSILEQRQRKDEVGSEILSQQKENNDILQILLDLMERQDPKTPFTITQLKGLLMDIIGAGTDTTATTLEWALSEMMQHPDIMRKAQAELEEVVGLSNMVQDSHLSKLRYLDAVLKETLRLHPALPLLVPHSPSESCAIAGYTIPKGATIFFNVWAMQRDPKSWEDPLGFCPERFLKDGKKYDYRGNDFHYLPFGSGRRICPGIPLAERMLVYVLASLLHSFEWRLPQGVKLDLSEKFGIVLKKKVPLVAIPTPRLLNLDLYS